MANEIVIHHDKANSGEDTTQGLRLQLVNDDPRAVEAMLLFMYERVPATDNWTDGRGIQIPKIEAEVCILAVAEKYRVTTLQSMMRSRIREALKNWDFSRTPGGGSNNAVALISWTISVLEIFQHYLGCQPPEFQSYTSEALFEAQSAFGLDESIRKRMKKFCDDNPDFVSQLRSLVTASVMLMIMTS